MTFTIGELAEAAGVGLDTVRYYERRGLLPEPPRTASGYRQYGAADLDRLRHIARAKQLGFTLAEIRLLADDADGILAAARSKLDDLVAQERALAETRARLQRLVGACADDPDDCVI